MEDFIYSPASAPYMELADQHGELNLEIYATFSKGIPAKISGPPDKCYPAEGPELIDWELNIVNRNGGIDQIVPDEFFTNAALDRFTDAIFDSLFNDV